MAGEIVSWLRGHEGVSLGKVLPSSLENESSDQGKLLSFEEQVPVEHRRSIAIVDVVLKRRLGSFY